MSYSRYQLALTIAALVMSTALPAMAQTAGATDASDPHAKYGTNSADWASARRGGAAPDAANPAALAQFDARAQQAKADIAARLTANGITAAQGVTMNAKLKTLQEMRANFAASGGGVSMSELEQLNTTLNELRMALRSRVVF